jgi:pimeloyl-ACP methyl ester carboxylesterase
VIAWDEAGSGPAIVLVHGLSEDRRTWDPVVALLADRFRCIRLDLRGHGESDDADDYSAIAMAADVASVVSEADVDEPPVVVGHSLGAVVATMYAAGAPVRGVVNVDQSLRFDDFAAALLPLADALRGPEFAPTFMAVIGGLGAEGLDEATAARLDELHAGARQDVVMGVWGLLLDAAPGELAALTDPALAAIDVPYLAIHGGDPGPDYAGWLRATIPTATLETGWGGGHYPHLLDPERFAARVAAFASS